MADRSVKVVEVGNCLNRTAKPFCAEQLDDDLIARIARDPSNRRLRRNEQQRALASSCGATFVRTACYYPGLNYD